LPAGRRQRLGRRPVECDGARVGRRGPEGLRPRRSLARRARRRAARRRRDPRARPRGDAVPPLRPPRGASLPRAGAVLRRRRGARALGGDARLAAARRARAPLRRARPLYDELDALLDAFRASGGTVAILDGDAGGRRFPDPALPAFGELRLAVPAEDAERLSAALEARGFHAAQGGELVRRESVSG